MLQINYIKQSSGTGERFRKRNNFLIIVFCITICLSASLQAQTVSDYRAAAERGDANAQYNLGVKYDNGQGVIKDYAQAVYWYRKAAEQGHSNAMSNLGVRYFNGEGVVKDYAEAEKWFMKALSIEKNTVTLNNVSLLYKQRGYVVAKFNAELKEQYENSNINIDELKVEAQKDNAAMFHLGVIYQFGFNGASPDLAAAKYWYEVAAKKGNPQAQNALGNMYYLGIGVEKNYKEAAKFYKKAQGKIGYAQYNLALMYYFADVKSSYPILKAISKWYFTQRKDNMAFVNYRLADAYATESLLVNDPDKYKSPYHSLKNFRKSAELGNIAAKYRYEELLADQQANPDKYQGLSVSDFLPLVTTTTTLTKQVSDLNRSNTGGGNADYTEDSTNSNSSSSSSKSTNSSKTQSKTADCGDAWRQDSRTYSDFETQLIKMRTYPENSSGHYTSDYTNIQSKMRQIREKWEARGCRINKSQYE